MYPVSQEIPHEASPEGAYTYSQWRDALFVPSLPEKVQPKLHLEEPHETSLCWQPHGQVPGPGVNATVVYLHAEIFVQDDPSSTDMMALPSPPLLNPPTPSFQ